MECQRGIREDWHIRETSKVIAQEGRGKGEKAKWHLGCTQLNLHQEEETKRRC